MIRISPCLMQLWLRTFRHDVLERLGLKAMLADRRPAGAPAWQIASAFVGVGPDPYCIPRLGDLIEDIHSTTRSLLTNMLGEHKCVCFRGSRGVRLAPFQWDMDLKEYVTRVLVTLTPVTEADILVYTGTARRGYKCPAEMSNARA